MAENVSHSGRWPTASLALQSVVYVGAGLNHFLHPTFYLRVMPDHYADPGFWVQATGLAEILGGLGLLLPRTRRVAAAGLCLMLVGFLDVHVSMLRHRDRFPQIPAALLWARLPMQAILIAWAARYVGLAGGNRAARTS